MYIKYIIEFFKFQENKILVKFSKINHIEKKNILF
jgi:hypothetical protein